MKIFQGIKVEPLWSAMFFCRGLHATMHLPVSKIHGYIRLLFICSMTIFILSRMGWYNSSRFAFLNADLNLLLLPFFGYFVSFLHFYRLIESGIGIHYTIIFNFKFLTISSPFIIEFIFRNSTPFLLILLKQDLKSILGYCAIEFLGMYYQLESDGKKIIKIVSFVLFKYCLMWTWKNYENNILSVSDNWILTNYYGYSGSNPKTMFLNLPYPCLQFLQVFYQSPAIVKPKTKHR